MTAYKCKKEFLSDIERNSFFKIEKIATNKPPTPPSYIMFTSRIMREEVNA